jgi:hypothetical protein
VVFDKIKIMPFCMPFVPLFFEKGR